jgi:hypothetical protein
MEWILTALAWPGAAYGRLSGLSALIAFVLAVAFTAGVALLGREVARERRARLALLAARRRPRWTR